MLRASRILRQNVRSCALRTPLLQPTAPRLCASRLGHASVRGLVQPGFAAAAAREAGQAAARTAQSGSLANAMRVRVRVPLVGNMCLSEAFGHVAFLLAGTAFLDPDILNLRLLSVLSGGATLVFAYFHPVGYPLWLPFGWNLGFMLINSGHITALLMERYEAANLPPQAVSLWKQVFVHHGVSAVDFAKLLGAGTWTTLRKGAILQEEGHPSNSVFLIVKGGATVSRGQVKSHKIHSGQFIGDMGLSSGISTPEPVRGIATFTTNQQTTCLAWPRRQLDELLASNPSLAAAFQAAVAADVMRNLQDHDRENHHAMWRDRYAAVLESILVGGECSPAQRQQLTHFRTIHRVTEAEHLAVLKANGWTEGQYANGTNRPPAGASGVGAPQKRQNSIPTTNPFDGGSLATEDAGWAQATSKAGGATDNRSGLGKSRGVDLSEGQRPLGMWDERRDLVIALQQRLNTFFRTGALEVDGSYGPLTQQAVELFQVKMGLSLVDGRAGPVTWRLLRQAHLRKLEGDAEDSLLGVVRGFETENVDLDTMMLQQKLLAVMGDDCGIVPDGHYGPVTQKVMAKFMASHGLQQGAEGQLTPAAAAVLRDRFIGELEAKALQQASTAATEGKSVVSKEDADLKLLQLSLNQLMHKKVCKADGVYGPRTRKAIEDFQRMFGLPAGGDVGEQLQTVMGVFRGRIPRTLTGATAPPKGIIDAKPSIPPDRPADGTDRELEREQELSTMLSAPPPEAPAEAPAARLSAQVPSEAPVARLPPKVPAPPTDSIPSSTQQAATPAVPTAVAVEAARPVPVPTASESPPPSHVTAGATATSQQRDGQQAAPRPRTEAAPSAAVAVLVGAPREGTTGAGREL